MRRRGFNFAELMLAVGVLSLVILTLVALVGATLRSNSKSSTLGKATAVADELLQQTIYDVQADNGGVLATSFWATEGVWRDSAANGQIVRGGTTYDYTIDVATLMAGGSPMGAPTNRVKKIDVTVEWWNSRANGGDRQGQGKLRTCVTQLMNENAPPPPP